MKISVLKRTLLWHLVFWGFAINYISYINLNITIVEMIATKEVAAQQEQSNQHSNISAHLLDRNSLEKYVLKHANVSKSIKSLNIHTLHHS